MIKSLRFLPIYFSYIFSLLPSDSPRRTRHRETAQAQGGHEGHGVGQTLPFGSLGSSPPSPPLPSLPLVSWFSLFWEASLSSQVLQFSPPSSFFMQPLPFSLASSSPQSLMIQRQLLSVGWLFITAQMLVYILADRVLFVEQVTMPEELTGLLFTVPVGLGLRAMTSGEATGMGTTWANLDKHCSRCLVCGSFLQVASHRLCALCSLVLLHQQRPCR